MALIEGRICVEAALAARQRRERLVVVREGIHPKRVAAILQMAEEQGVPVKFAPAAEIEAMAHGKTHGGVVALAAPKPPVPLAELVERLAQQARPPALLLLDGVDDSQNLGYTIRSAEALGIDAVLLKKHVWDFDATAVSRASSGAFERMPLAMIEQVERQIPQLKKLGLRLCGCVASARRAIYAVDLTGPLLMAIGGEKRGLSAAVRRQCDGMVRIPIAGSVGSLALSHAAAIVMAEVMRQRLQRESPEAA
ncbi:MAG: 23S rRNA (guanosine(2251)-2'-O)-methyltransferase RlmB [bacterium]|nr:23S rRNA (guanosine(2251)-2'-O)-methyltransferase RlmB [candidate division KSB1 bacterium]MDH7559139.1 23S rRNA (guanosine(2251)-2'-O)-methyltransferase RlmB [bacterium]